jgi:predicted transcriptional regulator
MNALRFLLKDLGRTQRDLVEATSLSRSRVSRLASFPAGELGERLSYYEAMEIQDVFMEWGGVDSDPPDFLALL